MRGKAGPVCLALGVVLVAAALALFLLNQWQASRAEAFAQEVLPQLEEEIQEDTETGEETQPVPLAQDLSTPIVTVEGRDYLGYLSLPTLGLELPVLAQWNYPNLALSPCCYTGSVQTGDLVIAGHNYRRQFGKLTALEVGDPVYFTGMNGTRWCYQVAERTVLAATAVEEMTSGAYDLTLFTCTYGGQSRLTIRCVLEGVGA